MKKLQVFICENFYPEYREALQRESIDDLDLCVYPTLCDYKGGKKQVKELLSKPGPEDNLLICSRSCDALKQIDKNSKIETITGNYCFTHLIGEEFLDYLTSQGSYIVTLGWLKHWEEHLADMGFEKDTARNFFQETSKQIVFLDAMIDANAQKLLEEFSGYINLPYLVVQINLEKVRLLLKSKVYEFRLHNQSIENIGVINALRSQTADYSAVFDMLGKISSYTNKRDVIGKVKDLFIMIFGAQKFKFWSDQSDLLPEGLRNFKFSNDSFTILKNENRFWIKVSWDNYIYGILDAGDFLFPVYIEKYLNLALDITKFLGLVLHNNEQYEKIVKSEKELKHLSFHDSMTDLFNRTFINQIMNNAIKDEKTIVFMFDIDKLKYANDNFGHTAGDILIKSFAGVLKQCFRETDIVARIGGDEFAAVLFDGDKETAGYIQNRIQELVKLHNENTKDKHLELSVSIGYSMSESQDDTIEELMKKADILMYEDKMRKRQK